MHLPDSRTKLELQIRSELQAAALQLPGQLRLDTWTICFGRWLFVAEKVLKRLGLVVFVVKGQVNQALILKNANRNEHFPESRALSTVLVRTFSIRGKLGVFEAQEVVQRPIGL